MCNRKDYQGNTVAILVDQNCTGLQSFPLHHMKGWSTAPPILYSGGGGGSRGKQSAQARSRTPTPSSRSLEASSKAPPLQQVGLPPLRKDAPGRSAPSRGSLPMWECAEHQQRALEKLRSEVYATSSKPTHESHLNTMAKALRAWGSLSCHLRRRRYWHSERLLRKVAIGLLVTSLLHIVPKLSGTGMILRECCIATLKTVKGHAAEV